MNAFGVRGDPSIDPKPTYDQFPNGEYLVTGIHAWFKKDFDQAGYPTFVPQKNQEDVVARFKFALEDGSEGPPMSMTRDQLLLMAEMSFGVDVSAFKKDTKKTSGFLLAIQGLINSAEKTIKVYVKDGWARRVEGMEPPANVLFKWGFVGFATWDGTEPLRFIEREATGKSGGKYTASTAYAWVEIVGDLYGNPTAWNGRRQRIFVENPFDGEMEVSGQIVPGTKVADNGGVAYDAKNFIKFWEVFGPVEFDHQWESDPEVSSLGINELENPLPVYNAAMQAAGRYGLAALELSKTGFLNLKLQEFITAEIPTPAVPTTKPVKVTEPDPKWLYEMVNAIEDLADDDMEVFEATAPNSNVINTKIRTTAKDWASETLIAACAAVGIEKPKKLRDFSTEDAEKVIAYLKELQKEKIPFDTDEEMD